ncbi:Hypothetical predicted protein, partial [Marmota monax]
KSLEQLLEVTEQQPHWVRWKTNLPAPDNLSPGSHSSVQPCTEVKVTGQNQEQFLLLAKSAKGAALATLIHQVLEAPGVYVIGELLDMPNVRELAESDFASTFRLLTVFACGTYTDYLAEARNLPPLTEAHLSVVTLAAKVKCIPYAVLLEALALLNVQQLEDLVIEAVYADVLRGSLDQRNQRLEVDYSIGPDIQRQDLSAIAQTLQEWCVGCEVVLSGIEEQVSRANQHKEQQLGLKQQIESEEKLRTAAGGDGAAAPPGALEDEPSSSRQPEPRFPQLSTAMSAEVKVTGQNQEQFLLLAKSAKGAALATLIHQVLEAPGVYVIGELLDMPSVRELAESDFASTFRLLTVFAYGTYTDYLAEARNLPPLTEAQKNKLRHLSVVTLAAKVKCIPYAVLLEALALLNVRQLEDLAQVDYSIGPDIQRQDLSAIAQTLQEWCVGCEVVLSGIEEQVSRANQHKEQQLGLKQQIESEVANLKKTIKVTTAAAAAATSQDPEQHLTELRNPAPGTNQRQPSKKASKGKGLGGSAKIWSKSN